MEHILGSMGRLGRFEISKELDYTTKKQCNNDQLIQQGAFLVVKISITMTRRKTGRRKYMFLRRVSYLVVNSPKPGCKYTQIRRYILELPKSSFFFLACPARPTHSIPSCYHDQLPGHSPPPAVPPAGHPRHCSTVDHLYPPLHLQFCDLGVLKGEAQNPYFLFCSSLGSKMVEGVLV